MSERTLSSHFLHHFVGALENEMGQESLATVLAKSGLPSEWPDSEQWRDLNGKAAAEAYAGLQKAIRTYYGRGARGTLIRVGGNLWNRLLDESLRSRWKSVNRSNKPDMSRIKATVPSPRIVAPETPSIRL